MIEAKKNQALYDRWRRCTTECGFHSGIVGFNTQLQHSDIIQFSDDVDKLISDLQRLKRDTLIHLIGRETI